MNIAIIDCGAGNLHSVRKAFAHCLPANATLAVVSDAASLRDATHIVLPGVGAFADCMQGLLAIPDMHEALEDAALTRGVPFLGVCVGMQMLFERGHEFGTHAGLGWFKGEVGPLVPADASLKIPHMGWNKLQVQQPQHPVLKGIRDEDFVYFVHSYAATGVARDALLATVDYGGEVVAMIGRANIVATQFHPEKSQAVGLRLITNFLTM